MVQGQKIHFASIWLSVIFSYILEFVMLYGDLSVKDYVAAWIVNLFLLIAVVFGFVNLIVTRYPGR